jgi:hypothetical protein
MTKSAKLSEDNDVVPSVDIFRRNVRIPRDGPATHESDKVFYPTSLPPLQPVENPTESALESCGEDNGLKSRQMPTCAGL